MLRKTPVALALAAAFCSSPSQAQSAAETTVTRLREITVTATRTEREVDAVPNTVTQQGAQDSQQRGARDLKDLLAAELDVAVRAAPARFTAAGSPTGRAGNEGISIRGLEGNQVLVMADGIRLPNAFSFGAFSSGRLDLVDADQLRSVDILRGPASAQFGSDGLAGAVNLTTLSPDDLLIGGKTLAARVRLSASTVDDSFATTAAIAQAHGDLKTLLMLTHRQGHETDNRGDNDALDSRRTRPDVMDISSNSLLAKAQLRVNAQHRLNATVEARERKQDTEVYSARTAPASTAATRVLDLDGRDKAQRQRASLEHQFEDLNGTWLQQARTTVYAQTSKTRQYAFEDRNTTDRIRDGFYKEALLGLSTQGQTQLGGALPQRLSYGLDLSRSTISGLRDGTVPPAGETLPSKPFPDTRYTLGGAFVQGEIDSGSLTLIPGLRFDHYKLQPSATGYTGPIVRLSDRALTPRLGLIWRATPTVAPYAQLAGGFRAPTPDQVNNGFANPVQGYSSIGNPNLKAEKASSLELGLRAQTGALRWHLAAYDNHYRNFIKQELVSGGFATRDAVYQYINLNQAHIYGAEARVQWQASTQLRVDAGLAYSHGTTKAAGVETPLDAVLPLRANLRLRYESGPWTAHALLTRMNGKARSQVADATWFVPPGATTLDLGLGWKVNPQFELQANVKNLSNAKYWQWSDVRGLLASSTVLDASTAPGRSVQLALNALF